MPSRTSCFNKTVFSKTLKRFWPMWVAFALILTLALPVTVIRNNLSPHTTDALQRGVILSAAAGVVPVFAFLFSILTAMACFGWLYQSRSAAFTAALPVPRRAMFNSCAAAGGAVLLGIHLLSALLTQLCLLFGGWDGGSAVWTYLAVGCLVTVCFYGFSLLCAQLTGSLLILPLVYGVLNFTGAVVKFAASYLLSTVIFGLAPDADGDTAFSPLIRILSSCGATPIYAGRGEAAYADVKGRMILLDYEFHGWSTVLWCGVFGLACLLLAGRLFRNRRMETAGDTVALAVLKPIFRACMGVGGAVCFGAAVYYLLHEGRYTPGTLPNVLLLLALMVIGGLIGWFGADMLIYKYFNVFKLHWKGAAVLTALLTVFLLGAETDLLGVETRLPDPEKYDSAYLMVNGEQCRLTEPENLALLRTLHSSIAEHKATHESCDPENTAYLELRYTRTAEDGRAETVLSRSYRLAMDGEQTGNRNSDIRALERLLNLPEAILDRKTPAIPIREDTVNSAVIAVSRWDNDVPVYFKESPDRKSLTPAEAAELYAECIVPDLLEGRLGRIWLVTDESYARSIYNISIEFQLLEQEDGDWNSYWWYTVPTVDSFRTNEWLAAHGVHPETLWEYLEREELTETLPRYGLKPGATEEYAYY